MPASSFLTQGPRAVANVMQVRAGLDLAVTRNVSVFAGFNSEFAERTSGYAGRGGLPYSSSTSRSLASIC